MKNSNKTLVDEWRGKIFTVSSPGDFNDIALEIFQFQYRNCEIYRKFVDGMGCDPASVSDPSDIPFLPVELFKHFRIVSGNVTERMVFESSGTTQVNPSKHYVSDLGIYHQSLLATFRTFFGEPERYCVLGLLPSYLERKSSSLVYMVDHLIKYSGNKDSGFFLDDFEKLFELLSANKKSGQATILFGVTFALLDFLEEFTIDFPDLIIIETGGMKGRREEIIREDLHKRLCDGYGVDTVYSEYGMTELLSQAYSKGEGLFECSPFMKVFIGDIHDPLRNLPYKKSGNIKIIDLANVFSCSFISTQDLGIKHSESTFEVLGRIDYSDIRGCSLLV